MNELDIRLNKLDKIASAFIRIMQSEVIQGELISSQQACELLNCSRHHLMKLSQKHDLIDPNAKGHRKYYFRKIVELIK